jgi:hypothetical protein
MGDTSIVQFFDTSTVIKSSSDQIILIQDLKKEPIKYWYENTWMTSLIIPILVAAIVAWLTNFINRKKNKLEIDKLKEETSQIKESYKPIVIATIQSVQEKLIINKISGLKELLGLSAELFNNEQIYYEGEGLNTYDDYLNEIFIGFSSNYFKRFEDFITNYGYFYNVNTFKMLQKLNFEMSGLHNSVKAYDSKTDSNKVPSQLDREEIKNISKLFNSAINGIRSELHLENNFIQDYIESKIFVKPDATSTIN